MSNPFPDLPPDEYNALLEDIEQRGIVYPIVIDQDGVIIDGHQRSNIAAALGIDPPTKVMEVADDAERLALAIALNAYRRQLTPSERRTAILRLAPTGMTQADIGRAVGVSQRQVGRVIQQAEEVGLDVGLTTTDEPALDRQGRPPSSRGGRPRSAKAPAPIRPSIHVVMKAFRRDLMTLLVAYEESARDEQFVGAFGDVIEAIRRVLHE